MSTNISSFLNDLHVATQGLPERELKLLLRKVILEGLTRVVLKTPVDTGRARGGWQVTLGISPDENEESNRPVDKSGAATISEGAAKDVPAFGIVFIANTVVYIERLEEGHSDQAPHGMLRVTFEELRAMFP